MAGIPRMRKDIANFIPYSWETPSHEIAARYGLKPQDIIRMDLNTSPYHPKPWLNHLSKKLSTIHVNLYPDTSYRDLRDALSIYTGRDADEIIIGNGADECLMMISQTYLERGDKVLISHPSYPYFRVCSEIMGGKVVKVMRDIDFSDNVEGLLSNANKETKIVFLCSPNNPTGNLVKRSDLLKLVGELESVIVVDEAYYEYCGQTHADLISSYPNLIIVRTFSKAFSLAGVRVGYAIAAKETIEQLNKVRPPNSVGVISTILAQNALKKVHQVRKWAQLVVKERERVKRVLERDSRLKVYESQANFLLIQFKNIDANKLHEKLMSEGVVVRNLSEVVENALRVTILTPKENNRFLKTLKKALDELSE